MFSNLGWGCMFELYCYHLFSNNTHHINQHWVGCGFATQRGNKHTQVKQHEDTWTYLNYILGGKCTSQPKLPLVLWSVFVDLLDFLFRPHGLKHETRGCIILKMDLDLCIHHLLSLYWNFHQTYLSSLLTTPLIKNDPVPGSPGVVPFVRGGGKPAAPNGIVDIVIDWL